MESSLSRWYRGALAGLALALAPTAVAAPLPRQQLDLIAQTDLYPEEVTLRQPVQFTRRTASGGEVKLQIPTGNRVKLLRATPREAVLETVGTQATVPLAATDLLERLERSREQAHQQRLQAALLARDEIPQPHVRATLDQIQAGDLTRPRLELALDAYPWPVDRVATGDLAREFFTFLGLSEITLARDEDHHLLVTGQANAGKSIELHWNKSLPRNQFFVRAPQATDQKLAKGFSYEIPSDRPILRRVDPVVAAAQEIKVPGEPKPLVFTPQPRAVRPPPLNPDDFEDYRQRFNGGELDAGETRRYLTLFEASDTKGNREELNDLVDWLGPDRKSYREEQSGLTATLYFEKPYLFITLLESENAYEFVVYPQGFWQSEPIRFIFERNWFRALDTGEPAEGDATEPPSASPPPDVP
ncbi:MAG: hypothetical protein AAGK14_09550 [Verrucomicrobiota bacterium]